MFKDIWARFILYLPVILMGCLAIATYWLVQTTPISGVQFQAQPVTHDADYFLKRFSLRNFDASGNVRTEVFGDRAHHYPDTQLLEIDAIRIKSLDESGRLTVASANRGLTNEDTSEVQLIGNAKVVREGAANDMQGDVKSGYRMQYSGEFLHAFLATERVISHKPVELVRGADWLRADTLDYDNVSQVIELRGRVHGHLSAQPQRNAQ